MWATVYSWLTRVGGEKSKLADRWENAIYVVVGMNEEYHTFRIQNASTGQEKVVHQNLIMTVNFLPLPDDDPSEGVDLSALVLQILRRRERQSLMFLWTLWGTGLECGCPFYRLGL